MPDQNIFVGGDLAPGEFRSFSVSLDDGGISVLDRGFIGEKGSLSITEARDRASRSSKAILEVVTLLTNVLDRHEATIRKRWAKKSTRQRQDLLRRAWPDIATTHAPDLAAYKRKSKARSTSGRDKGLDKNYALPYMNLEDLARGNAFPVLLNSRALTPPPFYLPNAAYRVDLWTEDPEKYGQIEKYEESATEAAAGRIPNVPTGLLVFEVQATLLQALRDIVALILQDKPLEVYAETGLVVPELPPLSLHPGEDTPSVTDLALARPYLVPEKVDVARLSSLTRTRTAEWVDYGWAMREDPGFFAEVVGDWHEHSSANFGKLASLHEKFANGEYGCEDEEDVPGYRDILERIISLLEFRVIEKGARELMFILPSAPPWRDLFVKSERALHLKNPASMDKHEVLWLTAKLGDRESHVPLNVAAIELAHLIHTDKQQRQNITALSARCIADLGLACELHKQVRMLSPKYFARMGAKFTFDPEESEQVLKDSELMDVLKPLYDLKMIVSVTHSGDKYLNLGAEVDLSNGKLRYPINRSRTKENAQILQAAERHLDEIWDKYDAHLEKHLSAETIEKLQTGVPKKEELRRTPDWVEPEPKPAQQTTEDQQPANVKFDGWTDESFNKSKLEIRVKPKTTGQPGSGYGEESS
ncbi:unnamed protein product [Clonostachys byssicola]|uniref:Uncharacterized protein n=1 Tax=Clonostachys byssicola TaxID=160290 RepID=A0A9N9UDB7_9HYPO|nr:unnamed protein product [Clonostachys byssicola]